MKRRITFSLFFICFLFFGGLKISAQVREIEKLPEVSTIGIFDGILIDNAYKVNEYYISAFDIKPEQLTEMTGMKVSVSGKLKIKKVPKADNPDEFEEKKYIKGPFFIIIKDKKTEDRTE